MRTALSLFLIALATTGGAQTTAPPATPEITPLTAAQLQAEREARRGRIVVINMWATWCPPCVEEFPDLVRFGHEIDPDEVAIMAISSDYPDDLATEVLPFLVEQQPPFPIFLQDEHEDIFVPAVDPEWTGDYPRTVVFDAEGNRVTSFGEFHGTEELHQAVAEARLSPPE
jgi:thiol-disulfide isomerase/thioredoxin